MKKNLFIFLVVCAIVSTSSKAQFNKGDRFIGGGVNVNSNNSNFTGAYYSNNNNNYFSSGLTPRYSWFLNGNTMNGIFLSGNYSRSKSDNSNGTNPSQPSTSTMYGFAAGYFIRKYKRFNDQFGWFLEYNAMGSYGIYKQELAITNAAPSITKSSSLSFGLNVLPGLYYRVTSAVMIEAGFGGVNAAYTRSKNQDSKSNTFGVGLNFPSNFNFGLQFMLGRKTSIKS